MSETIRFHQPYMTDLLQSIAVETVGYEWCYALLVLQAQNDDDDNDGDDDELIYLKI